MLWILRSSPPGSGLSSPFCRNREWSSLRREASGSAPYENLRALTRLHRVPATPEFDQAADFILAARAGIRLAGRARRAVPHRRQDSIRPDALAHLAWNVESARLWQIETAAHLARAIGRPTRFGWPTTATAPMSRRRSSMWAPGLPSRTMPARMCAAKSCSPTACCRRCSAWRLRNTARPASSATCRIRARPGRDSTPASCAGDIWTRSLPQGLRLHGVARHGERLARANRQRSARGALGAHVKAEVGPGHWTVVTGIIPGTDRKRRRRSSTAATSIISGRAPTTTAAAA